MRKIVLVLIVAISIPVISAYGEPYMKFVKVKNVDQGRIFVYQCDNSGNAIEVEQRYNPNSKSEEIRFITNGQADEWISKKPRPEDGALRVAPGGGGAGYPQRG